MLWGALIFTLLMSGVMADPLSDAVDRFREVSTYQVTVRSVAADGERQVIRYFYRKPGWVRMEFVQPHSGAVLIYDPDARKVRLWPFGLKHTLVLTLDSDNPLVRSARGHRVDRCDVGALLENLLTLRARGQAVALGEAVVAGRPTVGVDIIGAAGVTADSTPSGHPVHAYPARHSAHIRPPVPRRSGRAVGAQRRRDGIVSLRRPASSISSPVCASIHP